MIKTSQNQKNSKKTILVYSGIVWNSIWSHSHDVAIALSKYYNVLFLELPKLDDPNHIILFEKSQYNIPEGISVLGTKKHYKKYNLLFAIIAQLFTLKSFLKHSHKIDVVFTYNTYDVLLFLLAKVLGKKTVYAYVDEYAELAPPGFARLFLRINHQIFVRLADMVFCTAKLLELDAKKHNIRVVYLPNAVRKTEIDKARASKSIPSNKFVVGFLGGLGKWIDVHMIIEAAKMLKKEKIEFWIVGTGEAEEELKRLVNNNNLSVRLFGYVSHDDIYKYINSFNVALIPFKINKITNRVSPIKLFEYWVCKKPVICSRTYELKSFDGTILFADNGAELAKHILQLMKNKKLSLALGQQGYNAVVEKYNWERYGKIFKRLVDMV